MKVLSVLIKCYCFFFCRDMLISDLDLAMTYTEVCEEVRTMCGVRKEMPITLKWIDDEGAYDL